MRCHPPASASGPLVCLRELQACHAFSTPDDTRGHTVASETGRRRNRDLRREIPPFLGCEDFMWPGQLRASEHACRSALQKSDLVTATPPIRKQSSNHCDRSPIRWRVPRRVLRSGARSCAGRVINEAEEMPTPDLLTG